MRKRFLKVSLGLAIFVSAALACTAIPSVGGDTQAPAESPSQVADADTETPVPPDDGEDEPESPASPTPAPASTRPAQLAIVGDEEVVFDWGVDRCEDDAIPDLAVRAIRDVGGQVQLFIGNTSGFRMTGPDLNSVSANCDLVIRSARAADPALFTDNEWLASLYTEDGQTIYALVHNEYQGHTHPGQCPQNDYFACWFNAITMKISTDGGQTFAPILPPPGHHVASLPQVYEAGLGATGLRAPSNIIKGQDGYYYSFMNAAGIRSQPQWVCLMRTDDLSDPASWRFWDGTGFEGRFINPYLESPEDRDVHQCKPLDQDNIGHALNDSITYNTVLERYVLIGVSADHIDGREVWGWYYSFSDDLIHWTRRQLLAEAPLPWTVANPGSDKSFLYPSLLDPNSESRNFETTDMTAYLYMTRNNFGHGSLDRDLIRFPVEFSFLDED